MLEESVGDGLSAGWGEDAAADTDDLDVVNGKQRVDFFLQQVNQGNAFGSKTGAQD